MRDAFITIVEPLKTTFDDSKTGRVRIFGRTLEQRLEANTYAEKRFSGPNVGLYGLYIPCFGKL
jgi:hypothetical protein